MDHEVLDVRDTHAEGNVGAAQSSASDPGPPPPAPFRDPSRSHSDHSAHNPRARAQGASRNGAGGGGPGCDGVSGRSGGSDSDGEGEGDSDDEVAGQDGQEGMVMQMNQMVRDMMSRNPAFQLQATQSFRVLLSEQTPSIMAVVACGAVPWFVEFLTRNDAPDLQFEAAWSLTNIAAGTTRETAAVVEAGASPRLIALLESSADNVREQAIWALNNIAGDGPACRDLLLGLGVLAPLLRLLNDDANELSTLRIATSALSNLCRGTPPPDSSVVGQSLPTLARLICHTDEEVVADTCWAFTCVGNPFGAPRRCSWNGSGALSCHAAQALVGAKTCCASCKMTHALGHPLHHGTAGTWRARTCS